MINPFRRYEVPNNMVGSPMFSSKKELIYNVGNTIESTIKTVITTAVMENIGPYIATTATRMVSEELQQRDTIFSKTGMILGTILGIMFIGKQYDEYKSNMMFLIIPIITNILSRIYEGARREIQSTTSQFKHNSRLKHSLEDTLDTKY